jgi:hypothetical protein
LLAAAREIADSLSQMTQNVRYLQWQHAKGDYERTAEDAGGRAGAVRLLPATLYAAGDSGLTSVTPAADLGALSAGLSGSTGDAILSLPGDSTVVTRDPSRQVFLLLRYHFGPS